MTIQMLESIRLNIKRPGRLSDHYNNNKYGLKLYIVSIITLDQY